MAPRLFPVVRWFRAFEVLDPGDPPVPLDGISNGKRVSVRKRVSAARAASNPGLRSLPEEPEPLALERAQKKKSQR